MSERWVIKYDAKTYYSPCGLAVGEQLNAEVFLSRPTASRVAKRIGGRVVKLVAKRKRAEAEAWEDFNVEVAKQMETLLWKARAEKAEAEVERLRGPAPSDEEIGRATRSAYYEAPAVNSFDGWLAAGKAARALGGAEHADLPLRRREVNDDDVGRATLGGWDAGLAERWDDLPAAYRAGYGRAGRAAIALATRPVVPPTDGELLQAEVNAHGTSADVRRAVWALGGRSTITREELREAFKVKLERGFQDALRSLGIEVSE